MKWQVLDVEACSQMAVTGPDANGQLIKRFECATDLASGEAQAGLRIALLSGD